MSITNKTWVNGQAPQLDDVDLNNIVSESNNLIESSGQSLNVLDQTQTAKAVANYAAGGSVFYADSGLANGYILTPTADFEAPDDYFDGFTVKFYAANPNTTSSVINVNNLGTVPIKNQDGSNLIKNQISGFTELVYNTDHFDLVSSNLSSQNRIVGSAYFSANIDLPADNTATLITLDTVQSGYDPYGLFSAADNGFKARLAGRYRILSRMLVEETYDVTPMSAALDALVNNVVKARLAEIAMFTDSVGPGTADLNSVADIRLSVNDLVTFKAAASQGGAATVTALGGTTYNEFIFEYLGS